MDKGLLYSLCNATAAQLYRPDFIIPEVDPYKIAQLKEYLGVHHIKYVDIHNTTYHHKFHQVRSKPQIIYYIGNIQLLDRSLLGIVGPRLPSYYAKHVITDLLSQAKEYKIATISGLAEGVDSLCHDTSLQYKIPTIAVLGGGFEYYIHTKKEFIERIIGHGGLILSEFKIHFKPTYYSFPQRNRVIAGLSDIVFLPEARKKSGSLITVDIAIQSGKRVYATVNDIYSHQADGTNAYLDQGIIEPVYNLGSFLESHFLQEKKEEKRKHKIEEQIIKQQISLTAEQQKIIALFDNNSASFDDIVTASGYGVGQLMKELTLLELQGYISQHQPGLFQYHPHQI